MTRPVTPIRVPVLRKYRSELFPKLCQRLPSGSILRQDRFSRQADGQTMASAPFQNANARNWHKASACFIRKRPKKSACLAFICILAATEF